MTQEEFDDMLMGDDDVEGPCAPQNLRMSVPMPAAPDAAIVEEMDEDLEIAVIA